MLLEQLRSENKGYMECALVSNVFPSMALRGCVRRGRPHLLHENTSKFKHGSI